MVFSRYLRDVPLILCFSPSDLSNTFYETRGLVQGVGTRYYNREAQNPSRFLARSRVFWPPMSPLPLLDLFFCFVFVTFVSL